MRMMHAWHEKHEVTYCAQKDLTDHGLLPKRAQTKILRKQERKNHILTQFKKKMYFSIFHSFFYLYNLDYSFFIQTSFFHKKKTSLLFFWSFLTRYYFFNNIFYSRQNIIIIFFTNFQSPNNIFFLKKNNKTLIFFDFFHLLFKIKHHPTSRKKQNEKLFFCIFFENSKHTFFVLTRVKFFWILITS